MNIAKTLRDDIVYRSVVPSNLLSALMRLPKAETESIPILIERAIRQFIESQGGSVEEHGTRLRNPD
jgi:hypothetical protein